MTIKTRWHRLQLYKIMNKPLNNKQLECDILLEYYKNQIKKFGGYNILQLQSDCDRIYPGNMSKIYKPIKEKLNLLIKYK